MGALFGPVSDVYSLMLFFFFFAPLVILFLKWKDNYNLFLHVSQ